jgi:cell division protein FtsL
MRRSVVFILIAALITSVLIIETRHRSRLMFAELQSLRAQRDALVVEWGKLLLEEGTWSQHRRIESMARTRLNMETPAPDRIVVVPGRRSEWP